MALNKSYIYKSPEESLFKCAETIETPALIYDFNAIENVAKEIENDIKELKGAKLNIALKCCHNKEVLKFYANMGLGCDVASIYEYKIAKEAGFKYITTTAPAYKESHMIEFHEAGIIMDLDSIDQVETFGKLFPRESIGLRIRIPLPKQYENDASFGVNSRFGVYASDQDVMNVINKYDLKVKRLHVHTGQMTVEAFKYKMKYLLTIAEYYKDVEAIDLGGGLFYFYIKRDEVIDALRSTSKELEEWRQANNRKMQIIFEPGGALITLCGYLVTEVMSVYFHEGYNRKIVTVDSSAWNLAPWHNPNVLVVGNDDTSLDKEKILVAGNTLYERDFFGNPVNGHYREFDVGPIKKGNRLIFSASGGYTITNSRKFNAIPLPKEYKLYNSTLKEI